MPLFLPKRVPWSLASIPINNNAAWGVLDAFSFGVIDPGADFENLWWRGAHIIMWVFQNALMLSFVLKKPPNPLASILNLIMQQWECWLFLFLKLSSQVHHITSNYHQPLRPGRTPYLTSSPKTFPPRPTTNQAEKKTGWCRQEIFLIFLDFSLLCWYLVTGKCIFQSTLPSLHFINNLICFATFSSFVVS